MTVNLTFDIADILGTDFDSRRTKVWLETNIDGDVIIDATGNTIRLGHARATINADGTGSFTGLPATNGATNPTAFQYQVHVDYPDRDARNGRGSWASGWFSLTASSDLADKAGTVSAPPAEWWSPDVTMAGVDNNPASAFRVQQDARLSTTFAAATVLTGTGIDLTGATASTIAVQAKLDAVAAAGGGLVLVPKGTILVTQIGLGSNVTLAGQSPKSIIKSTNGQAPIYADGKSNVTVTSLHVDVSGVDLSGKGSIRLKNCDAALVERCTFDAPAANSAAIELEGCTNSRVMGNVIAGGGYGIIAGSLSVNGSPETNYNTISQNHVSGCALNGIFVTASLASSATTVVGHGNEIVNNVVRDCGDVGIESGTGMRQTRISGNYVSGSDGPNILVRDNISTAVVNNHANGNTTWAGNYGGGILVADQNSASSDITISNNICDSNTGPGIRIGSAIDRVLISGNKCRSNAQEGIYSVGAGDVVIGGNHLSANAGYGGIVIGGRGDNTANVAVSGNVAVGNPVGIAIYGQDVTATGNQCRNNTAQGILVDGTQANYCVVLGNTCRGNLHATADITVSGGAGSAKVAYNQGRYTQVGAA